MIALRRTTEVCGGLASHPIADLRCLTVRDGRGKGIRTPDLVIANETLYQLSYTPRTSGSSASGFPPAAVRPKHARDGRADLEICPERRLSDEHEPGRCA
jgi:hypothetical protein